MLNINKFIAGVDDCKSSTGDDVADKCKFCLAVGSIFSRLRESSSNKGRNARAQNG